MNSSTTLEHVTSQTRLKLERQRVPLARMLGFVLLALIAYQATAGVTHGHGDRLSKRTGVDAASFQNANANDSSSSDSSNGSQCLICRLHQHLFNSLLSTHLHIAPPPALLARSPEMRPSYLSHADTPQRGRAPPPVCQL
ncbi:MAG TPA: DUF2946 family protein [Pyrinomonadaceae bacterium]